MPTLATKNSQATGITTPTTTTTIPFASAASMATAIANATANSGGSGHIDGGGGGGVDADAGVEPALSLASATSATTTTTITDTTTNNYHYHHPPAPHSVSYALGNNVLTTSTMAGGTETATTLSSAPGASLTTFNGNSNLNSANGNFEGNSNHSSNNNNNNNITSNSNMNSKNANSNSSISGSSSSDGKKTTTTAITNTIREDITSQTPPPPAPQLHDMPSTSINNHHQLATSNSSYSNNHRQHQYNNNINSNGSIGSTTTNNHSNGNGNSNGNSNSNDNGNGNGNLNSILKGSKENLLQNCYNGTTTNDTPGSEVDDPGDGLGPLPPKWETAYTERGELYFIDHNTGTSHWLDPRLSKFQKKSLEDCGDDELPYGWEKIEDSLYGTYYIDHVNRRTQYENPVLEAKRRAAEQRQKHQPPPPAHIHATQSMQNSVGNRMQQGSPSNQQSQHSQRPQTPSTLNGSNFIDVDESNRGTNIGSRSMDMSQRGMQPVQTNVPTGLLPYKFTRNPAELQGERITASLLKSARGLGITIVGGDDGAEEFLQIKSIVPHGPAWLDGQLQTGDVLVYVNYTCVLGFTHHEMVNIFQSILPGETVTLEVCRGYPLPFDPNDPNTEVVTTIAVDGVSVAATDKQRRVLLDLHMDGNYNFLDVSGGDGTTKTPHPHNSMRNQHSPATGGLNDGFILMKKPDLQIHTFSIVKGAMGFGFTIADSAYGQKVKKILDYNCCTQLQEGDVLLEINGVDVHQQSHLEVVQILKDCSKTEPTHVKIQRGGGNTSTNSTNVSPSADIYSTVVKNPPQSSANSSHSNVAKLRKNFTTALFRSKTPTADLYSTQQKEILPIRPKTPLVDTRRTRIQTPNNELQNHDLSNDTASLRNDDGNLSALKSPIDSSGIQKSSNSLQEIEASSQDIPFLDPYPKMVTSLSERLAGTSLISESTTMPGVGSYHHTGGISLPSSAIDTLGYDQHEYVTTGVRNSNSICGMSTLPSAVNNFYAPQQLPTPPHISIPPNSYSSSTPLTLTTTPSKHHNLFHHHPLQLPPAPPPPHSHLHTHASSYPHGSQYSPTSLHGTAATTPLQAAHIQNERMQKRVNELLSDRRRVGFSTLDGAQQPPQKQSQQPSYGDGHQQTSSSTASHLQHSPAVSSVSQQAPISWLGSGVYSNTLQSSPGGNLPYIQRNGGGGGLDMLDELTTEQYELSEVTLERQALGFGFRIVGGTEEGSQVTVGHIVPGGAADNDHRINTGDEILSIDGINVVNSSHHKVVSLMGEAALRGQVTMILRRRLRFSQQPQQQQQQHQLAAPLRNTFRYPYDVIVSRHESEGFGFVIISSSNQYYGSTIGKLIPGSPADRCGELKVGDIIIAVNRINIAGMSHGDVVNLIKESGLHVRLTIGCPKDTLTTPTTHVGGTAISTLHGNSAQVSPGQLSQTRLLYTPLTIQQQQQQDKPHISPNLLHNIDGNGGTYVIDHSRTGTTTNYAQHPHEQQQQQMTQLLQQQKQQQLPPQL